MYGKLFCQMYDGTLGTRGPWQALITFQQLVILADKHGVVDMTAEAIARRTTIPLDVIKIGIVALEQPDDASRTPDEDGRRIVRLAETRDWGWRVVNYAKYRALRNEDERRDYHQRYYHAVRKPALSKVQQSQQISTNSTDAVSSKHKQKEVLKPSAESDQRSPPAETQKQDNSEVVEQIPLVNGSMFEVRQSFVTELDRAYPAVDPIPTLREIRAWCVANPKNRKTANGATRFINGWFSREQNKQRA